MGDAPHARLQQQLAALLAEPVALRITDNQRTMISARREANGLKLRLHHMFLHADASVLRALARYLQRRDRRASARLGHFIDAERHRIRRRPPHSGPLRTAGRHHELQGIFDRINARYFGGVCDARITWGRKPAAPRRRRRSIKLGSYCAEDALIRIHPALDREWVPRFFIEYVVYHEMLHHMIPARVRNGRRELHGPEFRAQERRFPHYARALAWEQQHVHRLLAR